MIQAAELESELSQFHGTDTYYKNFTGLKYTDGIQTLAELAGAHWLIDLVGSYQAKYQKKCPFQVWALHVGPDNHAVVTMREDDDQPHWVFQGIEFTDFPLPRFEFYCIDGVMLLKSEY